MTECIFEWTRTVISRQYLDSIPAKTDDEKYDLIRGIALVAMVSFNYVGEELTLEGSWESLVKIQLMLIKLSRLKDNTVVDENSLKEENIHCTLGSQSCLQHQEDVPSGTQENSCILKVDTSSELMLIKLSRLKDNTVVDENSLKEENIHCTLGSQSCLQHQEDVPSGTQENSCILKVDTSSELMLIKLSRLKDNTVVDENRLKEENIHCMLGSQSCLQHQEDVPSGTQENSCILKVDTSSEISAEETERTVHENEVYVNITVSRQFAEDGELGSLVACKENEHIISKPNPSLENVKVSQTTPEENVSQKVNLNDWDVQKAKKGTDSTYISPNISKALNPVKRYEKKKDYEKLAPFKFFCSLCSFKSKRESHFQRHMELHSRVSELFSCTRCDFTTIRLGHLRRHEMTHSDTKFHCNKCSYSTDHHKFLIRHQRIKHASVKRSEKVTPKDVLSCTECAYTTTRPYLFKRHMQAHARSDSSLLRDNHRYHCQQCAYRTGRKEHFVRHMNSVHVDKRPYLCDHCGKAFKRPDALKQHRITHASELTIATPYHCHVCAKKCRSQAQLTQHMAVHSNVHAFLCEICGSSFKTRAVQRKHVMTIHKNPKAFSCSHCSRRFNTQYALRRHTKQHSSEDKKQKQIGNQEKTEADEGVLQLLHGDPILIQETPTNQIDDSPTPAAIIVQVIGFVQSCTGDS